VHIESHDDVVIDILCGWAWGSGARGDGVGEFSGVCSGVCSGVFSGEVVGVGSSIELLALVGGVPRTHDVFRFVCWV